MSRWILRVVTAALAAVPAALSADPVTVSLSPRPIEKAEAAALAEALQTDYSALLESTPSLSGYAALAGVQRPYFARVDVGAKSPLVVLMGWTATGSKRELCLWVDLNDDRRFAADERVKTTPGGRTVLLGPVERKRPDGTPAAFFVAVTQAYEVKAVPTTLRQGTAVFAGKPVRLAVFDADHNGDCSDMDLGAGGGDLLLVDGNGDGSWRGAAGSQSSDAEREILPLAPLVQMPDGELYRPEVRPDGTEIVLRPWEGSRGGLRLECEKVALDLASEHGPLYLQGRKGILSLPAGRYQVRRLVVSDPGRNGYWRVPIGFEQGRAPRIRIEEGQTATLQCGPPFRTKLEVAEGTGRISVSLSLVDRGGFEVEDVLSGNGQRPPEPTLKIMDPSGRTVKVEKFHYG